MNGAAIFAGVAGWLLFLERYRETTHGSNPWTLDALINVHLYGHHLDRAAKLIGAERTSCYRSQRVNAAVGGVPDSDHLEARAEDLIPRKLTLQEGAARLYAAVEAGELGNVREVGVHKGHVHIGWYPRGVTGPIEKWGF